MAKTGTSALTPYLWQGILSLYPSCTCVLTHPSKHVGLSRAGPGFGLSDPWSPFQLRIFYNSVVLS